MELGSLNTPPMSRISSQESNAFTGWNEARVQPDDTDGDISELLKQLEELAEYVSSI